MKPDVDLGLPASARVAPRRKFAGLLLGISLAVASAAAVAAGSDKASADTASQAPAKWVARKLHFSYVGFTTHYSCDGLRGQVKDILQQLGARDTDLVVKTSGCTRLEGPEVFPGVNATFSALEPASGTNPAAADSQPVTARWEKVTLNSDTTRRTNAGGCELIEQVKKYILPLFTTRNLSFASSCFPHAESLTGAQLSVEVLLPVKAQPPQSPQSPPPQAPPP
jgi:hypothetical protein